MQKAGIERILIVGGGTAGWMCAAALAHKLAALPVSIELVESEAIGTVGVGEATVPHIRFFNATLGIDEAEFMRATKATFKLGIEFRNWGRIGDSYIHPFGAFGVDIAGAPFLQAWLRARAEGYAPPFESISLPIAAARRDRFSRPDADPSSLYSTYSYAYQFDAGLYGQFLRRIAKAAGVTRLEGRITEVLRDGEGGDITAVRLESGAELRADLFIDCSGFRSLLLGQTMGVPFDSWAHWLPCDRAIAVPCESREGLTPYTRATAREAGWIWRIPLQHRVGNGHVYCSRFLDDDEAERVLLDQLEGSPIAAPNRLRFEAGKRRQQWSGNAVAIGLSAGFLEPLESTSIHLIQLAISRLLELLPSGPVDPGAQAEFNRSMDLEYERIRDFLILHYCATERDDTPFWDYCRTMDLPDSLAFKIELFRKRGVVVNLRHGMFLEPSWIAVYLGQRVTPGTYTPTADAISSDELRGQLAAMADACRQAADSLPSHGEFLEQIGASAEDGH